MEFQKKLMLLNPVASIVYGLWFVLQPHGYLRLIERVEGDIPASLAATLVSLGAALIALGVVQWVMRKQTGPENLKTNMTTFGAVWAIIAVGMLIGALAYPEDTRSPTFPVLQALLFFVIAGVFYFKREPSSLTKAA